jgi:hypothetical protein
VVAGALEGHFGVLSDLRGKVGVIRCKNKGLRNQVLEEPLERGSRRGRE